MSYKAFEALKKRIEIEMLEKMTLEEINAILVKQHDQLTAAKAAYVKLTNCEQYGEDGEIKGHYCPNSLLKEFDAVFDG